MKRKAKQPKAKVKEDCDYETKWKVEGQRAWRVADLKLSECKKCSYVVKILKNKEYKQFQKEKLAFERANEVDSAPKLYDSYFCLSKRSSTMEGDGFFFLEAFEGDLESIWKDDYFTKYMSDTVHREVIFRDVMYAYMELVSVGILHKDFHPKNVVYKRDRNWAKESYAVAPTLAITDFAEAHIFDPGSSISSIAPEVATQVRKWIPEFLSALKLLCTEYE